MLISNHELNLLAFTRGLEYGEVRDTLVPVETPNIQENVDPRERMLVIRLRENPEILRLTIHDRMPQYLEVSGVHEVGELKIKYQQRFKF